MKNMLLEAEMKVKALKTYSDRETGELIVIDKIVEYKADRAKELIKKGIVQKVGKKPAEGK